MTRQIRFTLVFFYPFTVSTQSDRSLQLRFYEPRNNSTYVYETTRFLLARPYPLRENLLVTHTPFFCVLIFGDKDILWRSELKALQKGPPQRNST